ncbi:MAG: hypothetical protein DCC65_11495 [Planctomycetota bacterium]|nr:MAG: hypothetical protein DCC65_11495 [Planctomycetota bacterium]
MTTSSSAFDAVKSGDLDGLKSILASDPGVARERNEQGQSLVTWAAYFRRRDMLDAVLAADPPLDIFEAALAGCVARVAELLAAEESLARACSSDGFSALHLAAFFGHDGVAELLLEHGADPDAISRNAMGLCPLHTAANFGSRGVARLLLENGAEVNARQQGGFAPIHAAANNGDLEMLRLLIAHGADVDARTNDGKTPADMAAQKGHNEAATLLRNAV